MTESAGESVITKTFLVRGQTVLKGGKAGFEFVPLDAGHVPNGEPSLYFEKRGIGVRVGCIYTAEFVDSGNRIKTKSIAFVAPWGDQAERVAMDAASRSFDTARDVERTAKKEATRNLIQETMLPLRRAYTQASWRDRQALKVLVLSYLETGTLRSLVSEEDQW